MPNCLTFSPIFKGGWSQSLTIAAILAGIILLAIGSHSGVPHMLIAKVHHMINRQRTSDSSQDKSGMPALAVGRSPLFAGPVSQTRIGIDPSSPGQTETFANLVLGPRWELRLPGVQSVPLPDAYMDKNDNLNRLPSEGLTMRYLVGTSSGSVGMTIKCTFSGKATINLTGPTVKQIYSHSNDLEVYWNASIYPVSLTVLKMDPSQPLRNIDCRNINIDRKERFAPRFLNSIQSFSALRFMDWQRTNNDLPIDWTHRHTIDSLDIDSHDGVSLEDMVALAKLNRSDAWFNMPSRADDDYIRHFAQYVHDTLPPDRKVYVEFSNEVWNWSFPVSRHITQEGLDAHMSSDYKEAGIFRYSERLMHVMDIWADVFADMPTRLIRIASGQAQDTYRTKMILGYKDLPRHVDAFATAPYFEYDRAGNPTDLDEIFPRIEKGVDESLAHAAAQKALAQSHGLRFLAYEAGQGIVLQDIPLEERIQRDPRMYDVYNHYLDGWRSQIGDTIVMFGTVFRIRSSGAWGLQEYEGQAVNAAPKLRSVREQMAKSAN